MSAISGELLWRRIRFGTGGSFPVLAPGDTDIDTGVTQVNRSFPPGEPPMGVSAASAPGPGALPASRIQVIPQSPYDPWVNDITHGEPYFNTVTKTIHVVFTNSDNASHEVNVLIWDPHSMVSPGQADTYTTIG